MYEEDILVSTKLFAEKGRLQIPFGAQLARFWCIIAYNLVQVLDLYTHLEFHFSRNFLVD